jgi:hypothetical protein
MRLRVAGHFAALQDLYKMGLPVKFFQSIYLLGLAIALLAAVCSAQETPSRYELFRDHNAGMTALQPSWMGPLIQSDARISQAVRVSISKSTWPNAQTISYGNNHGISLLAGTHLQVDLDPPSFFRNHSAALHDGFGNAATQAKWRIASGNAEHGNFAVSALVYHGFAPRVYQNQFLTSFYVPAVAVGKGFGRFAALSTIGGILPTGKIAQQGRGIEWNMTGQVHPTAKLWLDIENNALFNYAGPFDGKTQNFLTPAAFYMVKRKDWGPTHSVVVFDGGMQIATSGFYFYNHNLVTEMRVLF